MTKELNTIEKLELRSLEIVSRSRLELLKIFPEILTESGKIDFEKLKLVLGESVEIGKERYGMNWPGKADCFKTIQTPSIATLLPQLKESIDFEKSDNLFLEGDNLEVLKLLQKSYLGQIKLIYIDPPYNTGNDFIYPDNYTENLQTYLEYTGQIDSTGKRFGSNTESDGRFHSKWLNMMYPRIFLAKNLLRDDGVIAISIDESEIANLRKICDEIFGEENFMGQISRSTGTRMGQGSRGLSKELDYILVYTKNEATALAKLPMNEAEMAIYDQLDEKGKYLSRSLRRTGGENRREDRPSMYYPVIAPDGTEIFPIAPEGYESRWVCGKDTYQELLATGEIEWRKVTKNGQERWQVYQKHYLKQGLKETSNLWSEDDGNKKATKEVSSLFNGAKLFDHPKPVAVIQKLIQLTTNPNDSHIVLDFFAGSGTTAHSVIEANIQDQGNRRFILVQLPEECQKDSVAFKEGFKTISEITKERIKRVISQKSKTPELTSTSLDFGFRVFKLSESNFKTWSQDAVSKEILEKQLELHVDHVKHDRSPDDILYEILLKSGFPLTVKVDIQKLGKQSIYSIAGGMLLVCIEEKLTLDLIKHIADQKPERVVCLDQGFANNDQLKANAVQIFKTKSITSFKTV